MQFAVKCLIGIAVFASPCAYDPEPRQLPQIAAMAVAQQAALSGIQGNDVSSEPVRLQRAAQGLQQSSDER
jgi:hypothetical protein